MDNELLAGILSYYYKIIVIVCFVSLGYNVYSFAQNHQENTPSDSTHIRVFFNKKPDSLLINDRKIADISNGSFLRVNRRKENKVVAYLNRYEPIVKKVDVIARGIPLVRFKFTHNFNVLDTRLYPNHFLMVGNVIYDGFIKSDNLLYFIPINGIAFIQQFFWMLNRDNYLDRDSEFDYSLFSEKPLSFYYGISSLPVLESEKILTSSFSFIETTKLTFTPGYAISIGSHYKVFPRFSIDANIDYFPFAKVKAEISNQLDPGRILSIKKFSSATEWKKTFYLISVSANLEIMKVLHQQWFLLLGGHYAPPENVEKKFTVEKYYQLVGRPPSSIYETFSNTYKFTANGLNTGFMVQSRYNALISFYFRFKYYFNTRIEISDQSETETAYNFFTGIQYHF